MLNNHPVGFQSVLIFMLISTWNRVGEVNAVPVGTNLASPDNQQEFIQEYAEMKHSLIYDFGYSKEFADLVEVNLKRAVAQERERQRQLGIVVSQLLRLQGQQGAEDYEEEETTRPTTPGASAGDVVRGIAGIVTSLGTLNLGNFWQSFVNFFPPSRRESAQAVVDASLGRRPAMWPTLPTTTTKLTTTTKDEDELDSEETTKLAVAGATSAPAISAAGVTPAVMQSASTVRYSSVTEAVSRSPTTKYTLIRRRTGTEFPDKEGLQINDNLSSLGESSQTTVLSIPASTPTTTSLLSDIDMQKQNTKGRNI